MNDQNRRVYSGDGLAPTICTMGGGHQEPKVLIGAIRGGNPENPTSRVAGLPTQQMLEINENGTSNTITTVQKDNVVVEPSGIYTEVSEGFQRGPLQGLSRTIKANKHDAGVVEPILYQRPRGNNSGGEITTGHCPTITKNAWQENVSLHDGVRVRKLTPLECWRLMTFDDEDHQKAVDAGVSNSQLYKQAGNSIVVNVLEGIFGMIL